MTYSKSSFTLNIGDRMMPALGMGTFRIRSAHLIMDVVDAALKFGYRMFDTASVYGNEEFIGRALKEHLPKYGLKREDIFITSKLAPNAHGGGAKTEEAFETTLRNLGLEYIDLYLIHFPGASKLPVTDKRNSEYRDKTWQKMTEFCKDGRAKAIGVSNYTLRHMKELVENNHGVMPAVNQVEWHPYYYQDDLLKFCHEHKVVLQAYCSLGGTSALNMSLIEDPVVKDISKKLNATRAQVLLTWALQHGVAVIPKSTNSEHIRQNIEMDFVIPKGDMERLDALGVHNIKYAWDPSSVC